MDESLEENRNFIKVCGEYLDYCKNIPIFVDLDTEGKNLRLLKEKNQEIDERISKNKEILDKSKLRLYIREEDKIEAINELQSALNSKLADDLKQGDYNSAQNTLIKIMKELFSFPEDGSLENIRSTYKVIECNIRDHNEVIDKIYVKVGNENQDDYSLEIHSINVMALTLQYCLSERFQSEKIKDYTLSALLHDIGKKEINEHALNSECFLTDELFSEMQQHPKKGGRILDKYDDFNDTIKAGALEHHEKLGGKGYPYNLCDFSEIGKILGILDSYENLYNDGRTYRQAINHDSTLAKIRTDIEKNKAFDKSIMMRFIYSFTKSY